MGHSGVANKVEVMMERRRLGENVWVAPQIALADLAQWAADGVGVIINNRPDGEEAGQPSSAETAAAARAVGIDYVHAPVMGLPSAEAVARVAGVIEDGRPMLMFCRSGTRSTMAWALAMRSLGRAEPEALRTAAAGAGYDLSRLPL